MSCPSPTAVLPPMPPVGGVTLAASPTRNTRPEEKRSAIRAAICQPPIQRIWSCRSGRSVAMRISSVTRSGVKSATVSPFSGW